MIQKGMVSRIAFDPSEVPKRIKRNHTTYLKITLPAPPSGCKDTDALGMTHARQAVVPLFRHDPKLVCYVYPKELKSNSKPPPVLQLSSGSLTTRYVLGHYCEKVWFSGDERWSTYLRIQAGTSV